MYFDDRVQRDECHRRIRGMYHPTRTSVEHGEVLILAVVRRAGRAAVLVTRDAAPEIPAARALHQVASERGHLANGRRSDLLARLRESRIPFTSLYLGCDVIKAPDGAHHSPPGI